MNETGDPTELFEEIAYEYGIEPDSLLTKCGFPPQFREVIDAVFGLVRDQYVDDDEAHLFRHRVYDVPTAVIRDKALLLSREDKSTWLKPAA